MAVKLVRLSDEGGRSMTPAQAYETYGTVAKAAKAMGVSYSKMQALLGWRRKRPARDSLTPEAVRDLLSYDEQTGVFTWRKNAGRRKAGDRAGYLSAQGRWEIRIKGNRYVTNRLAWFYMKGEWPSAMVDHKNCDPSDDRWENLRLARRQQNMGNIRKHSDSRSPCKGVYPSGRRSQPWQAKICVERRQIGLGRFKTVADAQAAYAAAAVKYFGEFARVE